MTSSSKKTMIHFFPGHMINFSSCSAPYFFLREQKIWIIDFFHLCAHIWQVLAIPSTWVHKWQVQASKLPYILPGHNVNFSSSSAPFFQLKCTAFLWREQNFRIKEFFSLSAQCTRDKVTQAHCDHSSYSSSKQNNLPAWVHRISFNQAKFLNNKILSLECTHNSSGQQH
jgi:hypothetical protein